MAQNFTQTIVDAALAKKALKVVVIDVNGLSDLCNFQIVCSGQNERQAQAIANSITEVCKEELDAAPIIVEGKERGNWVLIDYGHTIVHIFNAEIRDYYAIEQLWPAGRTKKIN